MLNISVAKHREGSHSTSEIAQGAPRGGVTGTALLQETRRADILTLAFKTSGASQKRIRFDLQSDGFMSSFYQLARGPVRLS